MIEARASKRFEQRGTGLDGRAESRGDRTCVTVRAQFFTWLNLVCLDAPLVAISWQWLFSHTFGIPLAPGAPLALFLSAWLIYLADRFGDSLSVNERGPVSLRQRFCVRHRVIWIAGIVVVAFVDLFAIARLDQITWQAGRVVAAFAVIYLVLNQRWPSLWRGLPIKEVSVGFLFAAGTVVGLAAGLTWAVLPGWLLFACLCALNCISIAVWERELDLAQTRVSLATAFPRVERWLLPSLALLAVASLVLAVMMPEARGVFVGISASALLLAGVHFFRDLVASDTRTALADLVLLTPVAVLVAGHFSSG